MWRIWVVDVSIVLGNGFMVFYLFIYLFHLLLLSSSICVICGFFFAALQIFFFVVPSCDFVR
jgi:hypothetical protein